MPTSTPYITFSGNAAEVLSYYQEVFGGELDLMTYDSLPSMGFDPKPGTVAHAQLHGGAVTLAGGDDIRPESSSSLDSEVYSFLLMPESVSEAEALIEKLTSTGGEVTMAFEKAPWGDHYGQVKDRYGVSWQFDVMGEGQPT